MLKMTATCSYRKIIRHCDNTGRKLTEAEFEKVNGSKLIGRVQIELWSDKLALIQTEVPIFAGREELNVGRPQGCAFKDELWEMAAEAALKAMKTTGAIVVDLK